MRSIVLPTAVLAAAVVCGGCYAEGNSLDCNGERDGAVYSYLTMEACREEARVRYSNRSVHEGYECRRKFLLFVTDVEEYWQGRLLRRRRGHDR